MTITSTKSASWVKSITASTLVFLSRLTILPANIKPVGAFGFFGNPILYFASIIAFDMFIKGFYPGFWITYLGFAAYPILGFIAKQSRRSTRSSLLLLPTASFLFFLISNFGVWLLWYPATWQGLLACYLLAVPFYTRTLVGDLVFGYGYLFWKEKAWKHVIASCQTLKFALH